MEWTGIIGSVVVPSYRKWLMRLAEEIARTVDLEDSHAISEACHAVLLSVGPKRRADVEDELIAMVEEAESDTVVESDRPRLIEAGFLRLIRTVIQEHSGQTK